MLGYHFLYDVNVIYGREPDWYLRPEARLWQQGICWCFILIAGFSFHFGKKRNLRRGIFLNICGLLITVATLLVIPSEAVRFGILSFMGCAVLLTIPLERGLERLPPLLGILLCFGLFLLFRHVDAGFLGPFRLPQGLYRFRVLALLGFPDPLFRSSDYFPLLPWYFLFLCGWFLGKLFRENKGWQTAATVRIPLLSALGRKTVWVYLLHQPVLMGICMLLFGR